MSTELNIETKALRTQIIDLKKYFDEQKDFVA